VVLAEKVDHRVWPVDGEHEAGEAEALTASTVWHFAELERADDGP
jgi:hypothetical protein